MHLSKRFTSREDGVAAVEFALLLPVLLIILMGVMEMSHVMTAQRKLLNATHSVADLLGQQTNISSSDMDDLFYAGRLTIYPFDESDLKIGVASVLFDDSTGDPTLDWTDSYNGGAVDNPTVLADGRGEAGASIIIVTATYDYTPLSSLIIPAATFTLEETTYVRPRTVDYVLMY